MERPRLKRSIELFDATDGHIYLLRGGAFPDCSVEGDSLARSLLSSLDGRRSREELAYEIGAQTAREEDDVLAAVDDLQRAGLLEDAAKYDRLGLTAERYDRQLRYFADVAENGTSAPACQERLAAATVCVLGLGGLGSWTVQALACTGVGRIVGIDGDRVERSNLNRQILYTEGDLGAEKPFAAARTVRQYNADVEFVPIARRLESAQQVADALTDADFVVHAADWPAHSIERWVNGACFGAGIPFITMSQVPPLVRIGPTYIPGETGCYRCEEATYRKQFALFDELAARRGEQTSPAGTLGPICGVLGAQAAMDIVHHLTGLCRPATAGRALIIDVRSFEQRVREVPRRADCELCGELDRGPADRVTSVSPS